MELELGLVAEHTRALVAYAVVLGCPLTHLCLQECESIVSECDSSVLYCEIALSGTRCLSCKPVVLVTLGGCHLLDSLVAVPLSKPARRLCGAPEKSFVRGIVLTPWEPQRTTLVEHVIELPSLLG